ADVAPVAPDVEACCASDEFMSGFWGTAEAKLLTPQSGGARNCGPTGDFAANVVCKLIRPGVERIKTQLAKPFHCFRRMYRLLCSVGEFFNHRPWRARGRQEAEPEASVKVRYPS